MFRLEKKQLIMLIVLFAGSFIGLLNQTLISPALPTIMEEMNIGASQVQWLLTAFTMVNSIMIPITAFLSDRYSTRRLFLIAMGFFAVGSLLGAWGPSFTILLLGRIVQAMGAGIMMPIIMTVLLLAFPVEQRGSAMGLFGVINATAPALGPPLSGVIIDMFNWHILFAIIFTLAIIDFVLAIFFVEGHASANANENIKLDKISVVLSSFGLGSLLFGFSSIGSYGLALWEIAPIAAGVAILALFTRRQSRLEQPMLRLDILKNRRFLVSCLITMLITAIIITNSILFPILIQDILGNSATVSGLVMLPGAVVSAVLGPIAGRMFDKRGPRVMVVVGSLGLALSTLPLCMINLEVSLLFLVLFLVSRYFFTTLINMPVNTWGMNALDNSVLNHGNAVNNTLRQCAGSLGTALVVSVYSVVTNNGVAAGLDFPQAGINGFNAAFVVQVFFCVAVACLAIFCVKQKASDVEQADPNRERRNLLASIMERDVYCLSDTQTVADAVQLFLDKNISAAPIVTKTGRAIGMISDGDLIRALSRKEQSIYSDPIVMMAISAKADPNFDNKIDSVMNMKVTQIATMGLIYVDAHASFDEVCRILGENHLKKAPVVDNGKLVGVINRSDVTMYAMRKYMDRRSAVQ